MAKQVVLCGVWNVTVSVDRGFKGAMTRAGRREGEGRRCKEKENEKRKRERGEEGLFCEKSRVRNGW